MAAPGCPTCSTPLRWFPDHNQWGCDRCRVMFPPNVQARPAGGGIALALGVALLVGGAIRCGTAPSKDSDGGGDVGAYRAENEHYAAVYQGGGLAGVGGVLLIVGLVRRSRKR